MSGKLQAVSLTVHSSAGAVEPTPVTEWTVGAVKREALIIPPATKTDGPVPVLFVFHGHGGSMKNMEQLGFQKHWPEAVIVCPQGLPTVTGRDPEGSGPAGRSWPGRTATATSSSWTRC